MTATASNVTSEFASPLTVVPLEPSIGAEIHGLDLRQPLSDAVRDEIKQTILEYKVVFFRDPEGNILHLIERPAPLP